MDDNMNNMNDLNNNGFNETNTNETANNYDNYRPAETAETIEITPAEPLNEAPAAEVTVETPAADTAPTVTQTVSWQGSSYSGTPAQDSAYSTYQAANSAQRDAYAQYAAGYGYVPGGSGPVQHPYTASVIPDA
ncbi:MAG: hypothetical protein J6U61_06895, partial [Lachnospiraceae bacterium]|nr:hypothetical protein [Lachnospiraceae bacterium]